MKWIVKLITILLVQIVLFADNVSVYYLTGKAEINFKGHLTRTFKQNSSNPITKIIIPEYISTANGLFSTQTISKYKLKFYTEPYKKEKIIDRFGNHNQAAYFKPVSIQNKLNKISYEITIEGSLKFEAGLQTANIPFPCTYSELSDADKECLQETASIKFTESKLQEKAIYITLKADDLAEAVNIIAFWVSENIYEKINKDDDTDAAKMIISTNVFNNRYGYHEGKLNAAAAMLRSVGIAVRIVNGICIDQQYTFSLNNNPDLQIDLNNLAHNWLEVLLPHMGWAAVDIDRSSLILYPAYLRRNAGADFSDIDQINNYTGKKVWEQVIDIDINSANTSLINNNNVFDNYFICAPINSDSAIKMFFPIKEYNNRCLFETNQRGMYKTGYRDQNIEKFDVIISKEAGFHSEYVQQVYIPKKINFKKISLPFYKLESQKGFVCIELYADNNGKLGDKIIETEPLYLKDMDFLTQYKWYDFKNKDRKTNIILQGSYYLIPRIYDDAIIHWAYAPFSLYYIKNDSFIFENFTKKTIMNGDFLFYIQGKEIDEQLLP